MRTEQDFTVPLMDESVELDYNRILVYADWLDEHDGVFAAGWRAVGLRRLCPFHYFAVPSRWVLFATVSGKCHGATIKDYWWDRLPGDHKYQATFPSRYEGLIALVESFVKLSPINQKRILEGKE